MNNVSILNQLLETISIGPIHDAMKAPKTWLLPVGENQLMYVNDIGLYFKLIDDLYKSNPKIKDTYSSDAFVKYLEKNVLKQKRANSNFSPESEKDFFTRLLDVAPKDITVFCPVSGVVLVELEEVEIGPFKIKYGKPEELFAVTDKCLHIGVEIKKSYDNEKSIQIARNMLEDFARIIHFIMGRFDNEHVVKFGLPLLPVVGDRVYVQTDSFSLFDEEKIDGASLRNRMLEAIPIDNVFFRENSSFKDLWKLMISQNKGEKITDMQARVLHSAIAVGESARTDDLKNAILYACVAIETLFSYNEGSLFNPSIGEQLSEAVAFTIGTNAEDRIVIQKNIKEVYGYRSAIVHGGKKKLDNKHIVLNHYIRSCIAKFLTDVRYSSIRSIEEFYTMIKKMKFS